MRKITIINKKLREYLQEKDSLVTKGRQVSQKIEDVEKLIAINDEKQKYITSQVEPRELIEEGEKIKLELNPLIIELEKLSELILKAKLDAIPKDVVEEYHALKKEKDDLETERNKLFLKVQKIKDRAIPMIQKHIQPQLENFEDIDTAELDGEKIVVSCYDALDEWKKKFKRKV